MKRMLVVCGLVATMFGGGVARAETFDPDRTMLGGEQEQWLLDTLAASTATWNVIGQQTIFGDVTLGGDNAGEHLLM